MIKYFHNQKYKSCDQVAREFTKRYGVKVTPHDVHHLLDSYFRKNNLDYPALKKYNGEFFYRDAILFDFTQRDEKSVTFINKLKKLKRINQNNEIKSHHNIEDNIPMDKFFDKKKY